MRNAIQNSGVKLCGFVREVQVLQNGIIVRSYKGRKNLVLNQGKLQVFSHLIGNCVKYCAAGTGTSIPTLDQTGLGTESMRTGNVLPGVGNNSVINTGTIYDASQGRITLRRTFDFPARAAGATDLSITELGWSPTATAGANLFSRVLLGAPVAISEGQSLRVIYDLQVNLAPYTPTANSQMINNWDTSGYSQLEGAFNINSGRNSFIAPVWSDGSTDDWPNSGGSGGKYQNEQFPGEPGTVSIYNPSSTYQARGLSLEPSTYQFYFVYTPYAIFTIGLSDRAFSTFGTLPVFNNSDTPYASTNMVSADMGSVAFKTEDQTYYRDHQYTFASTFHGSDMNVWWLRARGLTTKFTAPQLKRTTDKLQVLWRISVG